MKTFARRLALALLSLTLLAAVALGALALWVRQPPPTVTDTGAAADALARRVMAAMQHGAFDQLEAVQWTFAGKHTHLWDRRRHLARVRWADTEVLVDLSNRQGVAFRKGALVEGPAGDGLVADAYSKWTNDSFWLYPFRTFFDAGVQRALAQDADGQPGLLITYGGDGGVTPGDQYLWYLDADGRPTGWRMWVQILPVGGLPTTWAGWQTVAGVPFATEHRAGLTLRLTDLAAGPLAEVAPGPDPFAQIASGPPAAPAAPTTQPTR